MTGNEAYERFAVSRDGSVVTVCMESASRMNGLTVAFLEEFRELAVDLREDGDVRAVVLTGSDGVYSVGADLGGLDGDAGDGERMRRLASTLHGVVADLLRMRAPVVTAVNGVAAGGGFGLAVLGDVVLVSDEARLEYAYPRVGLTGDGGSTFLLPRLVGLRRAREIVLLDEPIGPERAVELGLATEVVSADELDARASELAGELAAGPTHAYGELKTLLLESFDRGLEAQLAAETDAIAGAARTGDYRRGHAAFFDDGSPTFEGE